MILNASTVSLKYPTIEKSECCHTLIFMVDNFWKAFRSLHICHLYVGLKERFICGNYNFSAQLSTCALPQEPFESHSNWMTNISMRRGYGFQNKPNKNRYFAMLRMNEMGMMNV